MGVLDLIHSATDGVTRNAPDLTLARNAGQSCYNYDRKAFNLIRANAVEKVKQHMPDEVAQAEIGRSAVKFVEDAAPIVLHEVAKCLPGGVPIYNMVSRYLTRIKTRQNLMTMQTKIDCLEKKTPDAQSYEKIVPESESQDESDALKKEVKAHKRRRLEQYEDKPKHGVILRRSKL